MAGLASLLPVPLIDDYLLQRGRSVLLRDVARRSGVELADDVLKELTRPPGASFLARAGLGFAGRVLRGAALPMRILDRARAALVTFQRATLVDHWARTNEGTLTLEAAKALRERMDAALVAVPLKSWRVPSGHADALRAAFDATPHKHCRESRPPARCAARGREDRQPPPARRSRRPRAHARRRERGLSCSRARARRRHVGRDRARAARAQDRKATHRAERAASRRVRRTGAPHARVSAGVRRRRPAHRSGAAHPRRRARSQALPSPRDCRSASSCGSARCPSSTRTTPSRPTRSSSATTISSPRSCARSSVRTCS